MTSKQLVADWFYKWETGDFMNLPISENFQHSSPFGIISGKSDYEALIAKNKDKFLGYRFEILDAIYEENKACVEYKAYQDDFELHVSEWYFIENNLITSIKAFYHIGEIREERKLNSD